MTLDVGWALRWVRGSAAVVAEHRAQLIELDRQIGDGDHGENMHRGLQRCRGQARRPRRRAGGGGRRAQARGDDAHVHRRRGGRPAVRHRVPARREGDRALDARPRGGRRDARGRARGHRRARQGDDGGEDHGRRLVARGRRCRRGRRRRRRPRGSPRRRGRRRGRRGRGHHPARRDEGPRELPGGAQRRARRPGRDLHRPAPAGAAVDAAAAEPAVPQRPAADGWTARPGVALVLVSHSRALAEGVAELAGQMAPDVALRPGGRHRRRRPRHGLRPGADRGRERGGRRAVRGGPHRPRLGGPHRGERCWRRWTPTTPTGSGSCRGPFVEGAVEAAVTAQGGGDLDAVVAAVRRAAAALGAAVRGGGPGASGPPCGRRERWPARVDGSAGNARSGRRDGQSRSGIGQPEQPLQAADAAAPCAADRAGGPSCCGTGWACTPARRPRWPGVPSPSSHGSPSTAPTHAASWPSSASAPWEAPRSS